MPSWLHQRRLHGSVTAAYSLQMFAVCNSAREILTHAHADVHAYAFFMSAGCSSVELQYIGESHSGVMCRGASRAYPSLHSNKETCQIAACCLLLLCHAANWAQTCAWLQPSRWSGCAQWMLLSMLRRCSQRCKNVATVLQLARHAFPVTVAPCLQFQTHLCM